jgi:hypothetical protein
MEMSRIRYLAGWVARTRPFAEPLSPRGPQPVVAEHRGAAKEVPMGRWLQKYRYGSLGTKAFRREMLAPQLA